jgi:hypothetical protein
VAALLGPQDYSAVSVSLNESWKDSVADLTCSEKETVGRLKQVFHIMSTNHERRHHLHLNSSLHKRLCLRWFSEIFQSNKYVI